MIPINLDDIPVIKALDIEAVPPASVQRYWLHLTSDGIGTPQYIPVVIVRGKSDKHVVGITAAVHGNELNGIPVIQRLINQIDPSKLDGVLVCIPVTNVPAFLRKQRDFLDGKDLNRIMPGDRLGNESDIYAYRLISRVINELDYLIDLHTASFGNINSFYVRANMSHRTRRGRVRASRPRDYPSNRRSSDRSNGATFLAWAHCGYFRLVRSRSICLRQYICGQPEFLSP